MNRPHPQPLRHRASSRSFDEKRRQRPSGVFANIGHFVGQHRAATGAGIGAIVVVGIIAALFASGDDSPPIRRMQDFTILAIVPPPPPPPPPPPDQKLPEPEMIEQTPITDPQIKEEAKAEEPKDVPPDAGKDEPPPGPLGLDAAAEGPGDNFNLAGRPGGRGLLGGGGGGGSRWGYYSAMVQQQIEAALRANARTRNSVAQIQVRLWADTTGRVTRVQIVSFTGDSEVDSIIRGEILQSLSLREPPPSDMPMPMVARITMRRSS